MAKEWPIGQGQLLNQVAERLSTICMDNEVIWVNPNIHAPFRLRLGQSSELGVSATNDQFKSSWLKLEVWRDHKRTGIVGRAIFSDKDGNFYRDIDLKGVGWIGFTMEGPYVLQTQELPDLFVSSPAGLADKESLEHEAQMAERFHSLGIRTYRFIAILKLHQILDINTKQVVSIEEAKKRGIIKKSRVPAIGVRAFVTKARVQDLWVSWCCDNCSFLRKDIKILVAHELGISNKDLSNQMYVSWFTKTLKQEVAKLHQAGFVHRYLLSHNVTADCRIVDLDSVEKAGVFAERRKERDLANMEYLIKLINTIFAPSV